MTMRPCIVCGEPTSNERSRCDEHALPRGGKHVHSPTMRGYDNAWRKLSERARKLQPFCSDCGTVNDLQADHTPQAWERKAKGLPIRLRDIDVVCGPCNRKRGAARGEKTRETTPGDIPAFRGSRAEPGRPSFSQNSSKTGF